MSKAAELASLASASETALSNRNLIINGAMQIAQRGTSSTTASAYLVDRFKTFTSNTDQLAFTQAQVADGPDGFNFSYKFTTTTAESALASNESVKMRQTLEGQNLQQLKYGLSSAEKITLSFYVKGSVTGAYSITANEPVDPFNLVGSTYTILQANTWEKKTVTFPANTLETIANNSSGGIYFEWHISAGSANTGTDNSSWSVFAQAKTANGHVAQPILTLNSTWQLTGVQIEVGSVATPFEHRSFGQDLALCQRYGWNIAAVAQGRVGVGQAVSATLADIVVNHPVTMRAAPTLPSPDASGANITTGNGTGVASTGIAVQSATPNATRFRVTVSSGLTVGQVSQLSFDATNDAFLDAEL